MSPKEKALEIYSNISVEIPSTINYKDNIKEVKIKEIKEHVAIKRITLMMVVEILKLDLLSSDNYYWGEVKSETEKL